MASTEDLFSRRVLGAATSTHHDAAVAVASLRMAAAVRGGPDTIAGVIFHTDYAEPCVKPRDRALACLGRVA